MNAPLPENVDDILPLTPAQTGMLLHAVSSDDAPGAYVAVVSFRLTGPLDPARFRAAFEAAVLARDAYRAGFVWEGVRQPLQVVRKSVELPWSEEDWRALDAEEAEERLRDRAAHLRNRRMDPRQPPLMDVTVIRMADGDTRVIWRVHHLVSDGWSTRIVLEDALARYVARGDAGEAGADAPGFRRYLAWLKARDRTDEAAFWRDYLAGITEPPRIDVAGTAALPPSPHQRLTRALSAGTRARAEALSRQLRITQSTLFSGLFALLLRRYTSADDVVFGQTSAGRPAEIAGIERAAGAFLNTLPVRAAIDPATPLAEFLTSHEAAYRARQRHEFAALAEVHALSDVPPAIGLFDYVFAFEQLPEAPTQYGDLTLADLRTVQSSNYPFTMLVRPGETLDLEAYVNPCALPPDVAEAMLDDYARLIETALAAPETACGHLFAARSDPPAPAATPAGSILEAFAAAVLATPDAPAVRDGEGALSYAELTRESDRIGCALVAAGVQPGDIVPVALPRRTGAVAAFLGVMKAGAAYVPIDLAYPPDRIAAILAAVAPQHIVAAADTPLPETGASRIPPDAEGAGQPLTGLDEDARAYVIFTSGSEGRPKGVEITAGALAHSTAVRAEVYGKAPGRFLLLSSLAFDSSVVGLYWTLTTGGELVIAATGAEQEPHRLGAEIAARGITTMLALPRLYDAMLEAIPEAQRASVETIIVAGEAVHPGLVAKHRATGGGARLFNEYGPTEATVWCSAADLSTLGPGEDISIGHPIPGVDMQITDPDGATLPDGVLGEIRIAGPTLARGYLNDPEQTVRAFPANVAGPRHYRSGDIGARRADGSFLHFGRRDEQVKIRGHRIELTEIENTAGECLPGHDAAALLLEGSVLGLAVAPPLGEAEADRLNAALARALPAAARPSRIAGLDALPRLPNGKTDRRALAASLAATSPDTPREAPAGDIERQLAGIWSDILSTPDIARDADFFDLGGDSLKSILLHARASEAGLALRPTDVFEHRTLGRVAGAMVARGEELVDFDGDGAFKTFNMTGVKTPVFLLHCNLWTMGQIAESLGPDHPVALLFSHHFPGSRIALGTSIEALAEEALADMAPLARDMPPVICGYSAGAMVALEVASRLAERGREPPLLCLIDPPYDGALDAAAIPGAMALGQGMSYARGWVAGLARRLSGDAERWRARYASQAYAIAMRRYRVPSYRGAVYTLLTGDNPAFAQGSALARALPQVEVEALPLDHASVLSDPRASLSLTSRLARRIKALPGR